MSDQDVAELFGLDAEEDENKQKNQPNVKVFYVGPAPETKHNTPMQPKRVFGLKESMGWLVSSVLVGVLISTYLLLFFGR